MHMRSANQVLRCVPTLRTEAICFVLSPRHLHTALNTTCILFSLKLFLFGGGEEGSHLWREAKTYATLKKTDTVLNKVPCLEA